MPHDPFATVCLQHAALRWLEARIRTSNPDLVGAFLFDEFAEALGEHLDAVDAFVMPALRSRHAAPMARQYVDAHWYLKRSLAELKAMDRRSDAFRKRLLAVMRQLDHQMTQEATELPYSLHESPPATPAVFAHAR